MSDYPELRAGIDRHDADTCNRHFAADVAWGSPFGATVYGYAQLHAIHQRLHRQAGGGPTTDWLRMTRRPRAIEPHDSGTRPA